jgi:hypothetical protein
MLGFHRTQVGSASDNALNRKIESRASVSGLLVFALPLLLAASGCGGEGPRVPVLPVSGKVTFQGKPPVGAQIVLHPVQAADTSDVAPSGVVGSDGSFTISAYDPGDGAPEGDYVATIQWYKFVKEQGGAGPNVIPKEYSSPATSPLKVSVKGGPTTIPLIAIK